MARARSICRRRAASQAWRTSSADSAISASVESDKASVSHEQREQREHGAAESSKRRGKRHPSNASSVSAEKPRVPSDKGSVSHERRKQRKQREYGAAESEWRATWRAFRMSSTGSVSLV